MDESRISRYKKIIPVILQNSRLETHDLCLKVKNELPELSTDEKCTHEDNRKDYEWEHDVRRAQYELKKKKIIDEDDRREWYLVGHEYEEIYAERGLRRYHSYNREQIHDIFSPATVFVKRRGGWGTEVINKIPDTRNDYVISVSLNLDTKEDSYFDRKRYVQNITDDGYVSWFSQPSQKINYPQIRELRETNKNNSKIFYFVRLRSRDKYTYLGLLKLISCDENTSEPVAFIWKIKQWSPDNRIKTMLEDLHKNIFKSHLNETLFIKLKEDLDQTSKDSKKRNAVKIDWEQRARILKEIGDIGELIVLKFERDKLSKIGVNPENVIHASKLIGDGLGYDIESFFEDGRKKYIEVKSTVSRTPETTFYVTAREKEVSKEKGKNYVLSIVYNVDLDRKSGVLQEMIGDLENLLKLQPTVYRAEIKKASHSRNLE